MDVHNEANNYFVSSRGIMKSCNYYSSQPISSIKFLYKYSNFIKDNNTQSKQIIYICSSALQDFIKNALNLIQFDFILVSGDCDEDMPNEVFKNETDFLKFINNPKILHWFCQNWIGTHDKVSIIPIGMDYHTMQNRNIFWGPKTSSYDQELLLNKIRTKMKPFWERKKICYSNFHFTLNTKHSYDRIQAINQIPNELIYYEDKPIIRLISWNKQTDYAFVISPHGGGYDCHRLWEALLLGCIPIVKTSKIDNLYDDLPVLIVEKWNDINIQLLDNTIETFKNKTFNYTKLTLKYWINKFNEY